MRKWLAVATRPDVVRRALGYAVVVGAILISINHGDALLRGEIGEARLLKLMLTVMVPYCVSTSSSVVRSLPRAQMCGNRSASCDSARLTPAASPPVTISALFSPKAFFTS